MGRGQAFGVKVLLLAVVLTALLAACYLPDKFKAEIRLGRNGDFGLAFFGDLVWAPLYRDIVEHRLKPEEIAEKTAGILKDLQRDTHFKKVDSLGQGRFKVEYQREGHLTASEEVTFVRRNAIIIMVRASPDGRVTVTGNTMKPGDAQTATTMGLSVEGEFRVVTDGLVKEHNATTTKPFGPYTVYIWTIQNAFSPPPHLVLQREGAWTPKKPTEPHK